MAQRKFITFEPLVLLERNIILSAPTGSGKTTAAVRAISELVRGNMIGKAWYTVPTIALANEVYERFARELGARNVGLVTSERKAEPGYSSRYELGKRVVVAPYETIDIIINSNPRLFNNSVVAIDEIHNITSPGRTTTLVSILANIKYLVNEKNYNIRVLAMSATIPEVRRIAEYLDAEVIEHLERPIELKTEIIDVPMSEWRESRYRAYVHDKLYYLTLWLASILSEGMRLLREAGVSVRLPSGATLDEKLTTIRRALALVLEKRGDIPQHLRERIEDYIDRFPIYIFIPNRKLIEQQAEIHGGVYHHRGVPPQEKRRIIAELRRKDPSFSLAWATHTLLQGVNLAFGTVAVPILRYGAPSIGTRVMTPEEVKQLVGRAGRPGFSRRGYAIVFASPSERSVVERALRDEFSSIPEELDYPLLTTVLAVTGRNIDVFARYAIVSRRELFAESAYYLRLFGVLAPDNSPTEYARAVARNRAETKTLAYTFVAGTKIELDSDALSDSDTLAYIALDYVVHAAWESAGLSSLASTARERFNTHAGVIQNRGAARFEQYASPYEHLLGTEDDWGVDERRAILYPVSARAGAIRELYQLAGYKDLTLVDSYGAVLALSNPGSIPVSGAIESLIVAAEFLADVAGVEPHPSAEYRFVVPSQLEPYLRALPPVLNGIRVLVRSLQGRPANEIADEAIYELPAILRMVAANGFRMKKTLIRDAGIAWKSGITGSIAEFIASEIARERGRGDMVAVNS